MKKMIPNQKFEVPGLYRVKSFLTKQEIPFEEYYSEARKVGGVTANVNGENFLMEQGEYPSDTRVRFGGYEVKGISQTRAIRYLVENEKGTEIKKPLEIYRKRLEDEQSEAGKETLLSAKNLFLEAKMLKKSMAESFKGMAGEMDPVIEKLEELMNRMERGEEG